jgi:predicted amidophosphoribosyltransferase
MAESAPSRSMALRWLAEARDALASILIPAPCRLCGALLNHSSRIPVCQACLEGFSRIPKRICVVCGLPLPGVIEVPGERSGVQHAGWKPTPSIAHEVSSFTKTRWYARLCC